MKKRGDTVKTFVTVTVTATVLLLLLFVGFIALDKIYDLKPVNSMVMPATFLIVSEIIIIFLACFWAAVQSRTTRKLRQTNEKMLAILENMPSMVYQKDGSSDFKYTFLSGSLLKLFKCGENEFRDRYINPAYTVFKDDKELALKQMEEQERRSGSHNLIYRIVDYTGKVVWVHDKGVIIKDEKNPQRLWRYSALIDISDIHDAQESLKLNEERYKMVMQHTRSVIFDWSIKLDSITFSDMWISDFGTRLSYNDFSSQISSSHELNEDDKSVVSIFLKQFKNGHTEASKIKLRITNKEGRSVWCEVTGKLIRDDYGSPSRVIGLIHDIDREKRERDKLKFKAQRDSLTKLYNNDMTQSLIKSVIETSTAQSRHIMFIIDIDDFKLINDSCGHLFGDETLREISRRIRSIFRSSDIIGRTGGDEFVVFLQDLDDEYSVRQKAAQLKSIFSAPVIKDNTQYKVTGSIGIALYPQDATEYYELFKKADEALYVCKRSGKADAVFYNSEINPDLPLEPIHKKTIKAKPIVE